MSVTLAYVVVPQVPSKQDRFELGDVSDAMNTLHFYECCLTKRHDVSSRSVEIEQRGCELGRNGGSFITTYLSLHHLAPRDISAPNLIGGHAQLPY